MIRSVGKGAVSIMSPLATMVGMDVVILSYQFCSSLQCIEIYRDFHHSCFLYLGSVVVDEFGGEPSFQQGLIAFLQALVEVALPVLSGEAGLVENPDTVDDLFRLCSRLASS